MITKTESDEIIRLAGLLCIKRVRQYAVRQGIGGKGETLHGTETQVAAAKRNFNNYLKTLTAQTASQFEATENG